MCLLLVLPLLVPALSESPVSGDGCLALLAGLVGIELLPRPLPAPSIVLKSRASPFQLLPAGKMLEDRVFPSFLGCVCGVFLELR